MGLVLGKLCFFSIQKLKKIWNEILWYYSCALWNELLGDIRSLQRYPNFKVAVKILFLNKIDWYCMFLQYLGKFYFSFIIEIFTAL